MLYVQIQKNYSDALDKSGVEGGGLVIPGFARQYPETWSLNSAEDAKASIAAPRSVTLSSCPLNAPDCMTPAQLEGVLTSTAGEMEQVLQQALEHHQSTLLRQAMEHHRAARLAEAALLYEHILRADVAHPDALQARIHVDIKGPVGHRMPPVAALAPVASPRVSHNPIVDVDRRVFVFSGNDQRRRTPSNNDDRMEAIAL